MKKILLTTAAVAAISASAFADMMEDQVYLRGDLIGSYFTKFKSNGASTSTKIKPQFSFGIDVGAGYSIMDNLRAEIVYNHPFASNMKGSRATGAATPDTPAANANPNTADKSYDVKHKPTIHAVVARLHGDIVDLGMAKLFFTGGLGWASVKDSVTVTSTVMSTAPAVAPAVAGVTTNSQKTEMIKHKSKNNVTWTLGGGAAFDVAEGVHIDVAYSYRDYGKAKSAKANNGVSYSGAHFTSHNVSVGARFDI